MDTLAPSTPATVEAARFTTMSNRPEMVSSLRSRPARPATNSVGSTRPSPPLSLTTAPHPTRANGHRRLIPENCRHGASLIDDQEASKPARGGQPMAVSPKPRRPFPAGPTLPPCDDPAPSGHPYFHPYNPV